MYRIIGADQKEYGPVTAEQLRQWVAEGRANAGTLISSEGGPWQPLGSFPEFSSLALPPTAAPEATAAARENAFKRVRGPAILLILAGGISELSALWGLLQSLGLAPIPDTGQLPPEIVEMMKYMAGLPINIAGLVLAGLVLLGGISMLRLRGRGLALTACVLGILCANPCCCPLGLAGGVWGLFMISRPDVKPLFE